MGKTKRFLLGVLASACLAAPATANPSGASVRHGQVTITPGVQTQIQQLTDQAIVDWNTFSIGSGESVRFLQPSDLSVILNRVTGVDPSIILGTLQANGNVFLINRNGILFGPDSVVNVGGLVASTLNLSNEDFLAGNYAFAQVPGSELAAVVNQGKITITPGGYAVLTGPSVINEGTIVAHAGKVVLASGEQATLNLDGRDLVHFSLSGQVSEGPVLLAPGMLSETIAATLGVAPSRQATQIVRGDDGSVRLVNSSGTLVHSGEIKVDAASGETAGSVLLDSSDLTLLTTDSVISASGVGQNSDGGEILVLSDMEGDPALGFTHVEAGALIAATGGETGDGGFIEVSGNRINLHGRHDLSAPGGKGGSFLLDPIFITVIDGDNAPTVVGDVTTIGDQWLTTDATGTSYTFTATRDILFDLGIAGNNPTGDGLIDFSAGGALALTIEAGTDAVELGSINLGDDGTTFRGLDFLNLVADGDILWGNSTVQVAGTILADAGGLLDLESSTIQATNRGDIDLSAGTRLEGGTAVVNPGAGVNTTGYLRLNSGGSIDLESGNFTVDGGEYRPFSVTAGTDLSLGSAVIDIFGQGTGGVGKGLVLTAGGDIDVGTVDLTFRDDINSSGSYSDLIRAGGRIFSSDTGGNSYSLNIISEAGLNIVASDGILLPELMLTVNHVHTGTAKRDVSFQAGNGDLDLRNSTVSVEGDVDLLTDKDLFLNEARIDITRSGDVLFNAGGNVVLESAFINENAGVNTTGFLQINAGGSVSLGSSTLEVDGDEVRPFSITAGTDLSLGSATIDVFSEGTGGTKGLLLTAGGDIDVGTVDLTFRDDINSSGSYSDLIRAGGRIFSSDTGGNSYSLNIISEAGLNIVASDGILLPELMLTVNHVHTGTAKRDVSFQAGNGDLDLRNSTVSVEGDVDFLTDQDLFLNNARIDTTRSGDVLLDAGGDVTLESASINASAAPNTTGFLHIDAGEAVTLGGSILKVDAAGEARPFTVTAGTDLNLGSALIDIVSDGTGGTKGLLLTAGGDIDLGAVDLTFRDDINSSGAYRDLIMAGGRIFSSDAGPYSLDLTSEAGLDIVASDGILLPELMLTVKHVHTDTKRDVSFQAGNGDLDLRNSTVSVEGDVDFLTDQDLFLNEARIDTTRSGDVLLDAGGDITLESASINASAASDTTGFLHIDAGGAVTLGGSILKVDAAGETRPFTVTAGTDLNLGSALIDIVSDGTGGAKGLLLTAGGDIDLGTVDLTFQDDINSSGSYRDLIMAGGRIFSSDISGDPYSLEVISEAGLDIVASNGIVLPNLMLTVNHIHTGTAKRDVSFQSGNGGLDLRNSTVSVEGDVDFLTDQDLFLNEARVDTTRSGDVLLDAGGDITLESASINASAASDTTGFLHIDAGGAVTLGGSILKVDAAGETRPFTVTAGTDLNLGSALIDIVSDGTGGAKGLLLTAGGDIDLGTVDLTFRDNINSSGSFFNQISAVGSISSTPGDGNPSNRPGRLDLVGPTQIQADTGDLEILDFDVVVNPEPGASTADLVVRAPNGAADFGESRFTVQNNLELVSDGNLDLSSSAVSAGNRLVVASNGGVSAILGGGVSVPDIQIFGYNTTTSMPDSTIATNGGVTLGLVTSGNTDLSIFATGDIDVTHTGGGSITAERLGLEGSGGTTSPSAIWSTGGDVSLVSDGTINLGKGAGDRGAAIIRSDAAADVTVQADQLVNSVTSGTSVIDAQSGGFVNIVGPTSAEALEVSAPGISVSLTDSPNSSSRVNIVGDSDFLKVAGNRSDIEVTELLSGNQLTMKQQTSDFVLTVDPLSVEGILYIDESDIALGDINTTADQTLAVRLGNTASISAAPTGFNLNIAGDLLLVAGGNIGTSSEPLTVPGGRTSIIAGGEVNIETAAADLTVAEVRQFDPFGNEVAFGEGFQSGGDLTIRMTGVDAALTQEEVIGSSSGNVAVEILDGDLVQSPGVANPAPVISGGTVALAVSGDVGTYDGTTATPIRINADSLVVDGGADVILEQPVGDLAIIEQATISGATYNTSGAVGDLRIQAGTGNLTVSTDLTVGGETALVTGADLDINPQFLPNSVFLNNSITSGQNLVILSNGDIVQNSGLLTAPAIGLGANGTVGAIGSPVNIQTNELALNPSTGHVFDSDGFTPVQSVSAVGVTVNQGAPPPPPPPPEPEPPVEPEVPVVPPTPPNEPTGPFIVDGNELIIPEFEVFESSFAQNNPDLVESYLDEVLTDLEYLELDPTKIPLGWYNDDDFLNKKFRR